MIEEEIKKLRDELFELRVNIKLEVDPFKKEQLMEQERFLFKKYKTLYMKNVRDNYKEGDNNDKYKGR